MDFIIFSVSAKTQKLSEIIYILQSHYPPSGNVRVILQVDFLNICDRKNSNLIYGGGRYKTSGLLFSRRPDHVPRGIFRINS